MTKSTEKKRTSPATPSLRPSHSTQSRQCSICRHRQRHQIEHDFLMWVSAREIARVYAIHSHTTIYRHAHATGLFKRRRRNVLSALDRIIEHVGEVTPTAASVLAAIGLAVKLDAKES